jgi:MoaA/NifB/PqqE/SkfB family radical SAM enzyme
MTLIAGSEKSIPTFSWMINNRCNYHCTYCCADELNVSEKIKTSKEKSVIRLVIAKLKLINFEYNLEILGGEPLLSKHIDFIISEVQKIDSRTSENTFIITNLSKRVELAHSLNNITIKASYHPEYDSDSFFNALGNISSLLVIMNIHPDPRYHRKTKERIDELLINNIKYELNYLTPIESIGFKSDYSDDIIKVFEKELATAVNPSHFISFVEGSNRFENKQCRPMFIDIDYSTGQFINSCTKEIYRLKITEDNLLISTCKLKFCECTLMLEYPKYD